MAWTFAAIARARYRQAEKEPYTLSGLQMKGIVIIVWRERDGLLLFPVSHCPPFCPGRA